MTTLTGRCAACGARRPLAELLVITSRHEPDRRPWFCCRSSFGPSRGDCLALAAGSADAYGIALADPRAARSRL